MILSVSLLSCLKTKSQLQEEFPYRSIASSVLNLCCTLCTPTMNNTPYTKQPISSFWRSAVAERSPNEIGPLWTPKFSIHKGTKIITAGSCFAQHIGPALASNGYNWLVTEPPPPKLPEDIARQHGYLQFSCRTGNIYSPALLRQWITWAIDSKSPEECWRKGDRFFDPFRPTIEPSGFGSLEELMVCRQTTLEAFRAALSQAELLILVLGFTEGWFCRRTNVAYPHCPGIVAGDFNEAHYAFHRANYYEARQDLEYSWGAAKSFNPELRLLLAISPVPITATATNDHVLVASTHTKSTLRAVAGDLAATDTAIDYFPSFEQTSSFPFGTSAYNSNLRTISNSGRLTVMNLLFNSIEKRTAGYNLDPVFVAPPETKLSQTIAIEDDCEDELLYSFKSSI